MTAKKESEFKNIIPPTYRDTMLQGEVLLILQNMLKKKRYLKGDNSEIMSFRIFLKELNSQLYLYRLFIWKKEAIICLR